MKKYNFVNNADNVELNIFCEIGEDFFGNGLSFKEFAEELKQYDDRALTINIDSCGGSVFDGVAMANAIKQRKNKTICNIYSICASIATHIACACDEVNCFENSIYMIHLASCGIFGNKEEMRKQIEILDKIDNILAEAYVNKTGMAKEDILKAMSEETWLTAQEAKDMGFVDNILDRQSAVAQADLSKYQNVYKNIPSELLKKQEDEARLENEEKMNILNKKIELLKSEIGLLK